MNVFCNRVQANISGAAISDNEETSDVELDAPAVTAKKAGREKKPVAYREELPDEEEEAGRNEDKMSVTDDKNGVAGDDDEGGEDDEPGEDEYERADAPISPGDMKNRFADKDLDTSSRKSCRT